MKMKEIRKRMRKYKKQGFSKKQLKEISEGFVNGLPYEKVDSYACLDYKPLVMRKRRKELEEKMRIKNVNYSYFNLDEAFKFDLEELYN